MQYTREQILEVLDSVKDPEIPVLSLVDLGVITELLISETNVVSVTITPTFSGCPAMDTMKKQLEEALLAKGIEHTPVKISFETPWSSDLLTEKGRAAIKKFGLAPPPMLGNHQPDIDILEHIACPHCNSENTEMKSMFGPTLCRSLHYCHNCLQAFEQFKPLG